MPFAKARVPVSFIGPPGSGRSKSGLPAPITTGTTVRMHLVEQPGVGELRGDVAAADDPEVALAGRGDHLVVEVGDRRVGDPHVDPVALEHAAGRAS